MGHGGGGGTLHDLILLHNPFLYFPHGEPSGTTAVNEGSGADGTYSGGYSLGNAALYVGGPTSLAMTAGTGRCSYAAGGVPASMAEMTIGAVFRPNAVTGVRHIIARDQDTGTRKFQFRLNGANMDLIKTTGTIQTISRAHGMSAAAAYFVTCTVTASGVVKLFVNGTLLGASGSITAADYGGASGLPITVGTRAVANEAQTNDRFSDSFVIATALSDSDVAALAAAGGFA